jgi:hypothetical protein
MSQICFTRQFTLLLNKFSIVIQIRIRKVKLKGRKLVAKDVKSKPNLDRILKSGIGYKDLKSIHT